MSHFTNDPDPLGHAQGDSKADEYTTQPCTDCAGSGVTYDFGSCPSCKGTGGVSASEANCAALAGAPAVQEGGARSLTETKWQIVVRTLLDVEHSLVVASALCPEPSIEEFRPEQAAITRALNVLGYRHGKDFIPRLDEIYVDKKD